MVRPLQNANFISSFLLGCRNKIIGVDWGGGNGRTSGYLREKGWNYDSIDPYGETSVTKQNLGCYNFCSAFEVFEHLPNPIQTLNEICEKCSKEKLLILIGTGSHDLVVNDQTRLSWWYAAPRNGHVSLFSKTTFKVIGNLLGMSYISFSSGTHILFRGWSSMQVILMLLRGKMLYKIRRIG